MKNLTLLIAISLIYFSSCSSGKYTASREYDDVYYSANDKAKENTTNSQQQVQSSSPNDYSSGERLGNDNQGNQRFDYESGNSSGSQQREPDYTSSEQQGGNTYVTNNYYDEDDYYDYAYSTRIKRFYHPYGWNYYDSYYTNSYWYDYNPCSWGVSIYLGYNFWHPHHSWGFNVGYGNPYAYDPWYSPYYGYGGGWGGYGHGYNHGYNNGYWDGYYAGLYNGTFNPYYYNSHDNYSYYYGPRGGSGSALNTTGGVRPISQLYASNAVEPDRATGGGRSTAETAPFVTPKHYSQQPEVKPVRGDVKNNVAPVGEIKNPRTNTDSYSTGGVKNPRDSESPSGEIKNPRSNSESNTGGVKNQPVKSDPSNYTPRDNTPVKGTSETPVRGEQPVRNNVPNNSSQPDRDDNIRNDNPPVRDNNIRDNTPRNNEPQYNNSNSTPRSEGPVRNPVNNGPVKNNTNAPNDRDDRPVNIRNNDTPDRSIRNNNSAPVQNDKRVEKKNDPAPQQQQHQSPPPRQQQQQAAPQRPTEQKSNSNNNSNSGGNRRR